MDKYINKVIQGDCLEELKTLEDNSVDSIVTDPPYHLVSIVKRFGKEGSAPAKEGKDGSFKRLSGGFMGKTWDGLGEDGIGIANNPEMWKECLRVLKPGGYLLSFGGTRTYHRMAVAIEDAGFEVSDMIEWVYGSGFPKSRNIGKDVEKINVGGLKNLKQIGTKQGIKCETGTKGYSYSKEYVAGKCMGGKQISGKIPVYEINNEWEGWGTALKPAHEPICMARKPLQEKTVAENVLKYGTGGINIDESRVEAQGKDLEKLNSEWDREWNTNYSDYADKVGGIAGFNMDKAKKENAGLTGRFPANLIHDNSEEVRECFPETKGATSRTKRADRTFAPGTGYQGGYKKLEKDEVFNDSGNASRFFKSIIYQAKASKSERNKGCDGLEEKETKRYGDFEGTDEHSPKLNVKNTNNHPTVKPIALMEYLIKMVTKPGGIVLDPFAGSGSTLVAAKQNGYQYIGIELTEEYIPIINARLNNGKEYENN